MRRLLLLGVGLLPLLLFGLVNDAVAGQTDGIKGEGGRPFTTTLDPANEVPAALGSDLRGTAKVTINLGQNELCWDLDYTTTQTVVAAHIHVGAAGTAPPMNIVFGFFNPPPSTTVRNNGCREGSHALLEAIASNPGGYYVNVHTTAHPGGAGRGQLTK
jgi:CHRD domain